MNRRAKIGATLGPSCEDEVTLTRMVRSGVDIARLNLSHGDLADHRRRAQRLRRACRAVGRSVALLADLQGPRFRVGRLPEGRLDLVEGQRVRLLAGEVWAPKGCVPVTYPALANDVGRGQRVLIDDGTIGLRVTRVRGREVECEVEQGGTVLDSKGINLPDSRLSAPVLTAKDRRDLKGALEIGADWVAVSFVRSAGDIRGVRRLLRSAGRELPVMAKIERREAIERLDSILEAADGLLVARGDLGVELPPEEVPILQKQIIEAANAAGKPVMTATQMLESMRRSLRPTRAEASDVANAVLDGSDSLLLTAETAAGAHPVEAVAMMASIIMQAESSGRAPRVLPPGGQLSVALSTCLAGCRAAHEVGARYLAVFTQSGSSARQTARFRPRTPILAFAASAEVARALNVLWGVQPRVVGHHASIEAMIGALDRALLSEKRVRRGELVVVLAGAPIGVSGTTNLMEVHRVASSVGPRGRRKPAVAARRTVAEARGSRTHPGRA